MQIKQGIKVLNRTLLSSRGRELTAVELLVIEAIWQDISYQQVSVDTNYEYATIRNASSRLFKDMEVAIGKSISKKNCKSVVFSLQDNTESQVDLADAPTEIQPFCGRQLEISQLGKQILADRAKVVALLGIGGIGKTAIAARLAQSLSPEFEFVIWRSLREAPPPGELFAEIVQFLSKYTEIELPSRGDRQILHILQYLRQHRCLIVFDNFESIFVGGALAGKYRPGYELYGQLLQQLGTTHHQSCLVLTSREAPPEIVELTTPAGPVFSVFLKGIDPDALQLLADLGLSGTPTQLETIVDRCQGNPLYLRIIANTIVNYFDSDIPLFLDSERLNYSKITNILTAQFERLSMDEKLIVYHLAVHRQPIEIETIVTQLSLPKVTLQVEKTLESLQQRSLIQVTQDRRYTMQNVVMEYMTVALIEEIKVELSGLETPFFLTALPFTLPPRLPTFAKSSSD